MNQEQFKPQLVMRRLDLNRLPDVTLPDGYDLRCYCEGDGPAWERIVAASFEREVSPGEFQRSILDKPPFRPERVLFVTCGDEPVATASAWDSPGWGPETGQLHMVGVKPEHRGKRLGYWVSLAALHQFHREGRLHAMLSTDDFRLAAIKTYLSLDFEPVLVHDNQRQRWSDVLAALGKPELNDTFDEILRGPAIQPGQ